MYGRRLSVSLAALNEAGHQFILDSFHNSFISKATQKPYAEAHHIVPISRQEDFEYELDQLILLLFVLIATV